MLNRLETYIAQLQADPINFLITMAYTWGVILISLILHECAHGYAAYRCGDPTAKMLGRLSLNPARHLDPIGTLCMFLFGFGWAKPVPVNPRNFQDFRRDDFFVSIAGVTVNMTIFILAVLLSTVINRVMMGTTLIADLMEAYGDQGLGLEPFVSPFYNVGNYIMEGDWTSLAEYLPYAYGGDLQSGIYIKEGMEAIRALMDHPWLIYVQRALLLLAQVNLTLAIFNLLPFPPLDGFHVVNDILLKGRLQLSYQLHQITRLLLMVLLFSGLLNEFLSVCVTTVYEAVLRFFLMLTGQI